jgi:hypothetical protein
MPGTQSEHSNAVVIGGVWYSYAGVCVKPEYRLPDPIQVKGSVQHAEVIFSRNVSLSWSSFLGHFLCFLLTAEGPAEKWMFRELTDIKTWMAQEPQVTMVCRSALVENH